MSERFRWKSYVNQLTYGLDLRHRVTEEMLENIATQLIEQKLFIHPVDDYYRAMEIAVSSNEKLSLIEEHNETIVRDLLVRLLSTLDNKRPWPSSPFATLESKDAWPLLRDAPVVGSIPVSQRDIRGKLNRMFDSVDSNDELDVLILRLRSGELVALVTDSYVEPGVTLVSHDDPVTTRAAFAELTQLPVQPR